MTANLSGTIRFSVIIPTLNRSDILRQAIEALCEQKDPGCEYEIIPVDNGSTDSTKQIVEELAQRTEVPIRYVLETRAGSHFARNTGFKTARGEILGLIDDDIIVSADWVRNIVRVYDNPEVSCAGSQIMIRWINGKPAPWLQDYKNVFGEINHGSHFKELYYPYTINAGNFSIRKKLLMQVGGYNPCSAPGDIKLTGDGETGLCNKVYYAGGRIFWVPDARAWHVQDTSKIDLKYMRLRMKINGRSLAAIYYRRREVTKKMALRNLIAHISKLAKLIVLYCTRNRPEYRKYVLKRDLFWSYIIYMLQIFINPKLRKLVEKNNWLDNEPHVSSPI